MHFCVKSQDALGSHMVSFPILDLLILQGCMPMTQSDTIWYMVGRKNTGCSWCTHISPVICISSSLAGLFIFYFFYFSAFSCSYFSHNFSQSLFSSTRQSSFNETCLPFSVCLIKNVIFFGLGLRTEIGFVMEEEENGQCMFYFIYLRKAGLISDNFN